MALFEFGVNSQELARRSWPITRQIVHFIFSIFEDEPKKPSKNKSWLSPLRIIK
jgi:hypothetical protein